MDELKYFRIRDVDIKLHGRMDDSSDVVPLLSNGHGIELNIEASQLWADVEADYEDYEPWAAIEVKGHILEET